MIKRITAAFLVIFSIFSLLSCGKVQKEYSHCELVLPLTEDYYETHNKDFDVSYTNGEYAVMVLRISFVAGMNEGISETLTPYEFGMFWVEKCQRIAYVNEEPIAFCEYYDATGGKELYYFEAFYRSAYAYFVILFASHGSDAATAREDFLKLSGEMYFKP